MLRLVSQFLQFAVACWLGLGLFALISALVLGVCESRNHDRYPVRSCR